MAKRLKKAVRYNGRGEHIEADVKPGNGSKVFPITHDSTKKVLQVTFGEIAIYSKFTFPRVKGSPEGDSPICQKIDALHYTRPGINEKLRLLSDVIIIPVG